MLRIIAGKHRQRKIIAPHKKTIIPTKNIVREALFSIINVKINQSRFLDLFSGSGSIGLEALSRGAKHVTFVDKSFDAFKIIKQNILNFNEEENTTILQLDYEKALNFFALQNAQFDLIFVDPPYETNYYLKIATMVFELNLLNSNGLLIFESEIKIDSSNLVHFDLRSYKYGKTFLYVLKSK